MQVWGLVLELLNKMSGPEIISQSSIPIVLATRIRSDQEKKVISRATGSAKSYNPTIVLRFQPTPVRIPACSQTRCADRVIEKKISSVNRVIQAAECRSFFSTNVSHLPLLNNQSAVHLL